MGYFPKAASACKRHMWEDYEKLTLEGDGWKMCLSFSIRGDVVIVFRGVRFVNSYPWTPKPWNMKVLNPQYMGYNPKKWVRNCFGNSFVFFRDFFFFFGWGWFWGCPGSFLGKPRGERQVRAGFSGHLGVVLGLSRLRSGETSGEMQVPSRFGHKKLLQKANCPVHFCFLCVFIYVDVCVCVFVIEYVVCVFFLLLFWFFIQCTSFLVFAIYLFNV